MDRDLEALVEHRQDTVGAPELAAPLAQLLTSHCDFLLAISLCSKLNLLTTNLIALWYNNKENYKPVFIKVVVPHGVGHVSNFFM